MIKCRILDFDLFFNSLFVAVENETHMGSLISKAPVKFTSSFYETLEKENLYLCPYLNRRLCFSKGMKLKGVIVKE